mmetsp:Transcript_114467/g.334669  ORF Transcript_114467/g.334669 Transcript_114467/m.334669 type:complete len:219 (-) Transcript_114467:173-829(-)
MQARWHDFPQTLTADSLSQRHRAPATSAMQASAVLRSSAHLEAARARLRTRFVARWPTTGTTELAMHRVREESAGLVGAKASSMESPLEAARQRVRARFLSKWPANAGVDCTSSGLLRTSAAESKAAAAAAACKSAHLAAAHERLHARFVGRWPADIASAGLAATPPENSSQPEPKPREAETVQLRRIMAWASPRDVPAIVATVSADRIMHSNLVVTP